MLGSYLGAAKNGVNPVNPQKFGFWGTIYPDRPVWIMHLRSLSTQPISTSIDG